LLFHWNWHIGILALFQFGRNCKGFFEGCQTVALDHQRNSLKKYTASRASPETSVNRRPIILLLSKHLYSALSLQKISNVLNVLSAHSKQKTFQ